MTKDEKRIVEAVRKCADARLPDDFADRLVKRIRESRDQIKSKSFKTVFTRMALVAASLTLLLGFVPTVMDSAPEHPRRIVAQIGELRPANHTLPQDDQLNALALLGFCREVVRRRAKPLFKLFGRRRDED